jgi:hypothetical protein
MQLMDDSGFCHFKPHIQEFFPMRNRNISFLLLVVSLFVTTNSFAQGGDKLPPLNIKEYKLKNGLTVVMHRDTSTPIVSVNLWYHVGSKNEAQGRTGFAHLFEHMMFQGSKNYIDGWRGVDELGGSVNGTTDQDRTFYFEAVPPTFSSAFYILNQTAWQPARRDGPGKARQPARRGQE